MNPSAPRAGHCFFGSWIGAAGYSITFRRVLYRPSRIYGLCLGYEDLDATDDPLHGNQEGRFFHGYCNTYCYLPLYAFCDGYLLAAELRPVDIDACAGADKALEHFVTAVRRRWPKVRIIMRADSGFAREWLMKWCEAHEVEYLFGLARNKRLRRGIGRLRW